MNPCLIGKLFRVDVIWLVNVRGPGHVGTPLILGNGFHVAVVDRLEPGKVPGEVIQQPLSAFENCRVRLFGSVFQGLRRHRLKKPFIVQGFPYPPIFFSD